MNRLHIISTTIISTLFYFVLQFTTTNSFAQIWHFGNGAGLKFSPEGTQVISGGQLYTIEGCATMSDTNGKLLFYTDGVDVWDNTHTIIVHGLNGNKSSTQSALIVKKPNEKSIYYIFTVDTTAGSKGACYSILDISKKVILKKNQQLLKSVTEKLSATLHQNGKDFWILFHQWNSNNFYAYPLTENGIGSPVISAVGFIHQETGSGNNRETIGEMKFSSDGKKIALAICYRSANNFELFDFDDKTGVVEHPMPIPLNGFPYGLCFSPDNSKIYISFFFGPSGICQYDLKTKACIELIPNEKNNSFGSLQIGFDGRIYVARPGYYLDLIVDPDKSGSQCNYKKSAIDLMPGSCTFGLPNYVTSAPKKLSTSSEQNRVAKDYTIRKECKDLLEQPFHTSGSTIMTELSVCENTYTLHAKNPGASYLWSTSQTTQSIIVDTSQVYRVTISKNNCNIRDSIRISFKKDLSQFRYLPQFNPDGDFFNTNFNYTIDEVNDFELTVYNKRKVLFQTNDTLKKWNGRDRNGKLVKAGEYRWVVSYSPRCGQDRKKITKAGKVIVERN